MTIIPLQRAIITFKAGSTIYDRKMLVLILKKTHSSPYNELPSRVFPSVYFVDPLIFIKLASSKYPH
jgi:hypothetical protein